MDSTQNPSDPLTDLVLATFRLNGALVEAGDRLVADLGLTSARWQVVGAMALAGRPLTVAQIARRMGLTRQAVQRVANDLEGAGLTFYADNPDHKRARLVVLTDRGVEAYARADARRRVWAASLARGLDPAALRDAVAVMGTLLDRLQADGPDPETDPDPDADGDGEP